MACLVVHLITHLQPHKPTSRGMRSILIHSFPPADLQPQRSCVLGLDWSICQQQRTQACCRSWHDSCSCRRYVPERAQVAAFCCQFAVHCFRMLRLNVLLPSVALLPACYSSTSLNSALVLVAKAYFSGNAQPAQHLSADVQWLVQELLAFGAVHWCPVPPALTEARAAEMDPEQAVMLSAQRKDLVSRFGRQAGSAACSCTCST